MAETTTRGPGTFIAEAAPCPKSQNASPEAAHLQPGDNPASSWTLGYGYKWWIPEDPQGDFTAIGVWGQYIYIDPARDCGP